jgi:hypothetical protein
LSIIFNQSLALKTVRKEWKNAHISAIFKKGNKSQAKNYRHLEVCMRYLPFGLISLLLLILVDSVLIENPLSNSKWD